MREASVLLAKILIGLGEAEMQHALLLCRENRNMRQRVLQKAKGRLVVHGAHRPILVVYDRGRVFALDNRCPHMGFPLDRGSVEDGILTCHWHHARFDLESGCTFDLWADDAPTFPVEVRNEEVWVKTTFSHADSATHWRQRLNDGLEHDIGLVIAKAVQVSSRPACRKPTSCGRRRYSADSPPK